MKRLIYISLVIVFGLCTVYSCVKDVDDKFDESASKRMEEALTNYRQILTSAPNGWIMRYFPQSSQKFGGYTFLMKFPADEKDVVYVSSEIVKDLSIQIKSLVSLKADMGPTLNFDTYNELFHYFSDPSIAGGDGQGYGYLGDYEFVFKNVTPQEIILMGKKTNNKIVMIPLPADKQWVDYLQEVKTMESISMADKYTLKVEGNETDIEVYLSDQWRYLNFKGVEENGSFIITATGIQFYEPLEVNKILMQNFDWDNNKLEFICTDPNVKAVLKPVMLTPYEAFVSSKWYFSYALSGTPLQAAMTSMKSGLNDIGEEPYRIYLGPSDMTNSPSYTYHSLISGKFYVSCLLTKFEKIDGNDAQVKITVIPSGERYGVWYWNNVPKTRGMVTVISGGLNNFKVYDLTTDNPLKIRTIKFIETTNPSNLFTLSRSVIYFPIP